MHLFNGGAYHQSQKGKLLVTCHLLEVNEWWSVIARVSACQTAVLVRKPGDFVARAATGIISAAWITRRNNKNNNKKVFVVIRIIIILSAHAYGHSICVLGLVMHKGIVHSSRYAYGDLWRINLCMHTGIIPITIRVREYKIIPIRVLGLFEGQSPYAYRDYHSSRYAYGDLCGINHCMHTGIITITICGRG